MGRNYYPALQNDKEGKIGLGAYEAYLFASAANPM